MSKEYVSKELIIQEMRINKTNESDFPRQKTEIERNNKHLPPKLCNNNIKS